MCWFSPSYLWPAEGQELRVVYQDFKGMCGPEGFRGSSQRPLGPQEKSRDSGATSGPRTLIPISCLHLSLR